MFYEKKNMLGFREIKSHEKNLFVSKSEKSAAISKVERDSLGRITKIVMDTNNPNAFNFESPNEVLEVAECLTNVQ